jgi:hypothetical protein
MQMRIASLGLDYLSYRRKTRAVTRRLRQLEHYERACDWTVVSSAAPMERRRIGKLVS